jgi:cytochrome c oxidase subunit 2
MMALNEAKNVRRVFIASANSLFGKGLEKMLREHSIGLDPEIRAAASMAETLSQLEEWHPDLVIVDYDDRTINRFEFLTHFVETDQPMRVMLVSLQASGVVIGYDRRTLTAAQAEDWLNLSSSSASYLGEGAESSAQPESLRTGVNP